MKRSGSPVYLLMNSVVTIHSPSHDAPPPYPVAPLTVSVIPSSKHPLCFRVSPSMRYMCVPPPETEDKFTPATLYQLPPGVQVAAAWLGDDLNIEEGDWKDMGCSDDDLLASKCSLGTAHDAVEFTVIPPSVEVEVRNSGGSYGDRGLYFDSIYASGAWSFPDDDGGRAVLSGFGSTMHQTVNLRKYLEAMLPSLGIGAFLDVPCGDMNWIQAVDFVDEICYFGGDVSELVIEALKETMVGKERQWFGAADLIETPIEKIEGVEETMQCASDSSILLHVRHLMFHLTIQENTRVLDNIESFLKHESEGSKRRYAMLSTHLRSNDNLSEFQLHSGHKINLFSYPYCLGDPIHMIQDGDRDLFMGLWSDSLQRGPVDHELGVCL